MGPALLGLCRVHNTVGEQPHGGHASCVRTEGLTRRYGPVLAFDSLDLAVQTGEIFGFLGPKGMRAFERRDIAVGGWTPMTLVQRFFTRRGETTEDSESAGQERVAEGG